MDLLPDKPIYEVIESETFQHQLPLLLDSIYRWDQIKDSLDFDLARNPRVAYRIPETNLYILPLRTVPPFVIYYSLNENPEQIILQEIHRL